MENTRLSCNQELVRVRILRPTNHPFRRSNMNHRHIEIALLSKIQKLRDTPALWMDQELRIRVLRKFSVHDIRRYPCMNMALPRPDLHLASRPLLHERPQEKIGKKEDFS